MTTCSAALKAWKAKFDTPLAEAKDVRLYCQIPPIQKLDNSLNNLKECERLALSTNQIDRLIPLNGMKKLKILSVGRNLLKRLEKLDDVADSLEELWASYNSIASLDGLQCLKNLKVLYLSNNMIREWGELDKLSGLGELRDILLVGNPIYEGMDPHEVKLQILRRLPQVQKIDGEMVKPSLRDEAAAL